MEVFIGRKAERLMIGLFYANSIFWPYSHITIHLSVFWNNPHLFHQEGGVHGAGNAVGEFVIEF